MSLRVIAFLFVMGVAVLAFVAWPKKPSEAPASTTQTQTDPGSTGMPAMPGMDQVAEAPDPGLKWTVPARWTVQGDRPMRLATYAVPAAKAGGEPGECAVFYFGPSQGGGVEDNIDRWVGQFENPSSPLRTTQTVHGIPVARVKVHGDYLAPGGPNMESQGKKPDYLLLGAIATGPRGAVFFKFTGPAKAVEAAAADFDRMLASLKKS
jgi:hypothetical protein